MKIKDMNKNRMDYICDDDLLINILSFYDDPKNKKNFKKWKKGRANDIHRSEGSNDASRESNI